MRVRQQKLLKLLAVVSVLASVTIVTAAFYIPIAEPPITHTSVPIVDSDQTEKTTTSPTFTLSDLEKVCEHKLQRPLFDPPPPPPKPKPRVEKIPPPVVSLVMIVTGEENRAMFRDSQGSLMYKTQGESVSDARTSAEVFEIKKDHVVLKHNEDLIRVTLNTRT